MTSHFFVPWFENLIKQVIIEHRSVGRGSGATYAQTFKSHSEAYSKEWRRMSVFLSERKNGLGTPPHGSPPHFQCYEFNITHSKYVSRWSAMVQRHTHTNPKCQVYRAQTSLSHERETTYSKKHSLFNGYAFSYLTDIWLIEPNP